MSQRHTLRSALLLLVLGIFFSGFVFSDNFYFGRQNPILRNYFLQRYLQGMSYTNIDGTTDYRGDVRFIEQYVDRQVEDFLKRVNTKLYTLQEHLTEVQLTREEVLSLAPDSESRRKAQKQWKDSFKSLANEAKDLRKMLSYVLRGLDSKNDFKPQIQNNAGNSGFRKEIRFIEEQLAKAEQRINDYFYLPTHTVSVENLKGENMMIYLYRVEKISQKLSKELPSG